MLGDLQQPSPPARQGACSSALAAVGPRRARGTSGVLKIRKHGVCYLKLRIDVLKQDPSQAGGKETAAGEQDVIPAAIPGETPDVTEASVNNQKGEK